MNPTSQTVGGGFRGQTLPFGFPYHAHKAWMRGDDAEIGMRRMKREIYYS
jgi:hypothetical protein